MNNLNWHGLVAMVLALGLAAAVILLCLETILHVGPVSDTEAAVLSTVLGAAVGTIATYLGGARTSQSASPDPPQSATPAQPPPPAAPPTPAAPAAETVSPAPPASDRG